MKTRIHLQTLQILVMISILGACGEKQAKDESNQTAEMSKNLQLAKNCQIDWKNLDRSLTTLPEYCVDYIPSMEVIEENLIKAGHDLEDSKDILLGFGWLKVAQQDLPESNPEGFYVTNGGGKIGGAIETIKDAVTGVDIDTDNPSINIGVSLDDPNIDGNIGLENPAVNGEASCDEKSISARGQVAFNVPFSGKLNGQPVYNGYIRGYNRRGQPKGRHRNVTANISVNGNARFDLNGSVAGNDTNWNMNMAGQISGWVSASVDIYQVLNFNSTFKAGDASIRANFVVSDSASIYFNCQKGRWGSATGRPQLNVNVHVQINNFYGLLFPRLQGPVLRAIRRIVVNWANRKVNPLVKGLVDQNLSKISNSYVLKKQEFLAKNLEKLPKGIPCGTCSKPNPPQSGGTSLPSFNPAPDRQDPSSGSMTSCRDQPTNSTCTSCCINQFKNDANKRNQCFGTSGCATKPM